MELISSERARAGQTEKGRHVTHVTSEGNSGHWQQIDCPLLFAPLHALSIQLFLICSHDDIDDGTKVRRPGIL